MTEKLYIGIDPGKSGGIGLIGDGWAQVQKMPETEKDIWTLFENLKKYGNIELALIEKVHSMPAQGVRSTFNFGMNYGFLRACLIGNNIRFDEVTPQKWQRKLNCQTKGNKNITKAKAQQLFPQLKITHATADAILIAYYAKNFYREKK